MLVPADRRGSDRRAPQSCVREPRELARLAGSRRAARAGILRGRAPRLSRVRAPLLRQPTVSSCQLLPKQALTPRRRSCRRDRSPRPIWPRLPSGCAAARSAGSACSGCSTPRPPPTCSPGTQRVFHRRFSSGSHSSTAMCPAIFGVSNIFSAGRGRKSTRPGANGVVEHSPFEFQADGPGGGGVSARVPSMQRRHPADRVQTAFRVRNHPWPSHSWQPPVAADFLSASQGRSGRSSPTWVNRSNRRRCRLLVARPPTGPNSCKPTTTGISFRDG